MIIFIDDPRYINNLINRFGQKPFKVLNLSSLYSGNINITNIITDIHPINNTCLNTVEFVNSMDFDYQFANHLLNDINAFYSLMQIILPIYNNIDVYILVQRDEYRDCIMESLIKFIQSRYGINSWIIENIEDIEVIENNGLINASGLIHMNEDCRRYQELFQNGFYEKPILDQISVE